MVQSAMTAPPLTAANPFPKNTSERTFQEWVMRQAKIGGWLAFHPLPALNSRGRWATFQQGDKGYPDCTFARKGVVMFRELKSNTGSVTPEQKIWGEELGELWDVWRPKDYLRIKDELGRH